jgi:hypothetical protein
MSLDVPNPGPQSELSRARVRREVYGIVADEPQLFSSVVTELQGEFAVQETVIREEMQRLIDAGLLYGDTDDNAEVRVP